MAVPKASGLRVRGAMAAALLAVVLASSGCSSPAPSCAAEAGSALTDFSDELVGAGIAVNSEVIDDCGSGGSLYSNIDLEGLDSLDLLSRSPWNCRLASSDLDAPHDEVGYTCQRSHHRFEVSAGAVRGRFEGQVWSSSDLTED